MKNIVLKKRIKDDGELRYSFNELAKKIFGLDFEDWYQNGYWGDGYIPYSFYFNGKIVANVSASVMEFEYFGETKKLIQLGTIMTDEEYRNQGLIRKLILEIEKDYGSIADGFFLFANDSVLDLYPKFGFRKSEEYQYSKDIMLHGKSYAEQVVMKTKENWKLLENAITKSICNGNFEMRKNIGMILFYVTKFMQENVYYIKEQDTYVIAEQEEDNLLIHTIISGHKVNLDAVIEAFGTVSKVMLGFTPKEAEGYRISKVREEDTTLYVKGHFFENLNENKIMFPTLSHA